MYRNRTVKKGNRSNVKCAGELKGMMECLDRRDEVV